ncbi:unannotated protein [freshwater metagenome]|uniref:Unannotated protein n=1 Tax=freshwater metagenome TaxID=449393 RepID=A0A6J6WYP3_9ZZZZ
MILGSAGPRNDDGRNSGCREFGDGACAGSRDHQIGGRIDLNHVVFVADDVVHDAALTRMRRRCVGQETLADYVAHCKLRAPLKNLDHFGDSLIDGLRTKRSAEHGDKKTIVGNAELFASVVSRCHAIKGDQFATHRRTRDARVGQLGALECHRAHACETGADPSC